MRKFLALGGVLTLSVLVSGQGANPLIGTWQLNVAKSKLTGPAQKSEIRTYSGSGQDIKAVAKIVDASGKTTTQEWIVNYDGKEHPEVGNPDADTISFKVTDFYHVEFTERKAGKVVITGTRVISKDGKTFTATAKGVNAKGQAINDVMVFEKQ